MNVDVRDKDHSVRYVFFFFQAEDGILDLVRSRGLGDVYKRQILPFIHQVCDMIISF